jgi:predicted AAA+ superfamily ATPase
MKNMAHLRNRYAYKHLKKKIKFSPVLFVQGARQVGKSFLIREIFAKEHPGTQYVTLDNNLKREMAQNGPETFLLGNKKSGALVIDEAQKSPALFDSIKEIVDINKTPGQFILLGSTEFSHLTKVRESLTGRASRVRIFPFLLSETKHLPLSERHLNIKSRVTRKDLLTFLDRGGMPGIFAIRNEEERQDKLNDWLALTCERDINQVKKFRLDSELCFSILQAIGRLENAEEKEIVRFINSDPRKIKNHLLALESLFVINRIPSYRSGTGRSLYFLLDCAFIEKLGGGFDKKIKTYMAQEILAQMHYRTEIKNKLYYYRSSKAQLVDFVIEIGAHEILAIKIFTKEKIIESDLRLLKSFATKAHGTKIKLIALAPVHESLEIDGIQILPWESVC